MERKESKEMQPNILSALLLFLSVVVAFTAMVPYFTLDIISFYLYNRF